MLPIKRVRRLPTSLAARNHVLRMDHMPASSVVGPMPVAINMSTTTTTTAGSSSSSIRRTVRAVATTAVAVTTTTTRPHGTRLKHIPVYLNSDMRKASFKVDLCKILQGLGFEGWTVPETLSIEKVSGSLTNAVFFVHNTAFHETLLLRIYGPSTSSLISRRNELHMLHVLSTRYGIGPRVHGTFLNGRVEQYFDSTALSAKEMRDPVVSGWIGRRMRELHGVDVRGVLLPEDGESTLFEEGVRRNVKKWIEPAKRVEAVLRGRDERVKLIDLKRFEREWEEYWDWLMNWEKKHGKSERVFAHNDTQYGNLLRLKNSEMEGHKRIIVVDFEYASLNAASFDIANHFQEWMADYHGPRPHEMEQDKYPTKEERYNFYRGYGVTEERLRAMDESVKAWSRASEGMWAVWGVVQAHCDSDSDGHVDGGEGSFDYIGYALSRMLRFRTATYSN